MANEALAAIVGRSNLLTDREARVEYSFDSDVSPPVIPGCVAKPANADEVARIVTWANTTSTPLVPVSSGPLTNGETRSPGPMRPSWSVWTG